MAVLDKIGKLAERKCVDCGYQVDNAEHALFKCDSRSRIRRDLELKVDRYFEPDVLVEIMVESRAGWKAVWAFVQIVLTRE